MTNRLTSELCAIDVRKLQRDQRLVNDREHKWAWTQGDQIVGWVSFVRLGRQAELGLRYRQRNGMLQHTSSRVWLEWTPCHYGGSRPWFRCPVQNCFKRVAVLYARETIACRTCSKLSYQTQRIEPRCRAMHRAQMIRVRLGGTVDLYAPFPPRPAGMHEFTYYQFYKKAIDAEAKSNSEIGKWVDEVKARHAKLMSPHQTSGGK